LHHKDVSHARDHLGGTRSPQHLRAIELRMPHGIGQDLEYVVRWNTDPPRYGNRLVLTVSHQIRLPFPEASATPASPPMLTTGRDAPSLSNSSSPGMPAQPSLRRALPASTSFVLARSLHGDHVFITPRSSTG